MRASHASRAPGRARRLALVGLAIAAAGLAVALASSLARQGGPATFDGVRAAALLGDLCRRGNRFPGAPERPAALSHLQLLLDLYTDQSAVQRFSVPDPAGEGELALANLIARLSPSAPDRILLATHWDTRRWSDEDPERSARDRPVPGANDGTSGVAVLIELLQTLDRERPVRIGVDVVLFDGQDVARLGSADACEGSRYFARMLRALYPRERPRAAVVVDMVGDCDQQLVPEESARASAPELSSSIWSIARRLGHGAQFREEGSFRIVNDHVALIRAGIPTALLMDYDDAHWHTQGDTPERVCAESLGRVGEVLLELLREEDAAHD